MKRTITCRNGAGLELTFGSSFNPFVLVKCEGIYDKENQINTAENYSYDGEVFQSSKKLKRNITLYLRDHPSQDHEANRVVLYELFRDGAAGTLIYRENPDAVPKAIKFYTENVLPGGEGNARAYTVSLVCPDPNFTALAETVVLISGWQPLFCFPHSFVAGGEAFGQKLQTKLVTIRNDSAAASTGLNISIQATGTVVNPTIHHVESGTYISVGTEDYPYEMNDGDELLITTGDKNKHIYAIVDGNRTEVNSFMDVESTFIQLQPGINTIGYSAADGERFMDVSLSYLKRYLGV